MFNLKNKRGISLIALVLIIIAILIVGGIITGVVIINKNKNKEPITGEQFKIKMQNLNYFVQDATSQFEEYDYVKEVYISAQKELEYQIEFYELNTEQDAISSYNINKSKFEAKKSSTSTYTEVALGNNSKYTLTSNGQYMVVSRIENTFIYVQFFNDSLLII